MKVGTKQLTDDLMQEIKIWREIIKNKTEPEVILSRISDRPIHCNVFNQAILDHIQTSGLTYGEMPQYIDMIATEVVDMLKREDYPELEHGRRWSTLPTTLADIANRMSD